jgi:undecaprenyl-diphosphatase
VADPAPAWSEDLAALAPRHADDPLDHAALALSSATAPVGNALAAAAVAGVLARASRWRDLGFLTVALGGAGISVWLVGCATDVERPVADPLGPSAGRAFPSAHAASWAALATAVVLLAPRRRAGLAALAGALAVLAIGASRVYLGAHDPRDVVAGIALGIGWVGLVAWGRARLRPAPAR